MPAKTIYRCSQLQFELSALRAENETLKRHLAKVANKTQQFDIERASAEKELREIIRF